MNHPAKNISSPQRVSLFFSLLFAPLLSMQGQVAPAVTSKD